MIKSNPSLVLIDRAASNSEVTLESATHKAKASKESAGKLPCTPKLWERLCDATSQWKSVEDVLAFVQMETAERKQNRKGALTKKLGQDQWKELRSKLKDMCSDDKIKMKKVRTVARLWVLFPETKGFVPRDKKHLLSLIKG